MNLKLSANHPFLALQRSIAERHRKGANGAEYDSEERYFSYLHLVYNDSYM